MTRQQRTLLILVTGYWSLATGLTGCESFQRKFTRKSKPQAPTNPIINFQDYTQAMTPLDRYRKHYLIFDYWNEALIDALKESSPNPKLFKRASAEALGELQTLKELLTDDVAARLEPIIAERSRLNEELHSSGFNPSQATILSHQLEAQARQIKRDFFWRDVEEHLKPRATTAAP